MGYDVLIVEDDPMVADIISQFLLKIDSSAFNTINTVSSLRQAKKIVDIKNINLLLLDVYLPDGKGIDFLTYLRQVNNSIAVIMITAADDRETIVQAMNNGVVDYLIKPFQLRRFEKAINKFFIMEKIPLDKKKLSQKDINIYFQGNNIINGKNIDLPKGISKVTLKMMVIKILSFPNTFSNQDLSDSVKLSRVTTKKYLDYLVSQDYLKVKVIYLDIGRPLSIYLINHDKIDNLRRISSQ